MATDQSLAGQRNQGLWVEGFIPYPLPIRPAAWGDGWMGGQGRSKPLLHSIIFSPSFLQLNLALLRF